eukprot:g7871.t1
METTTLASSGEARFEDGTGTSAKFNGPCSVALSDSYVIVADHSNHRIRKITPDGAVSTLAGSGSGDFADGHGTSAHFNNPVGVAVDGEGNIIVADYNNHRIRKITPSGDVTTVAGSGSSSFADGHGTSAHFNLPRGVAVDGEGNIIVADYNNHRIRKITPSGDVTTVAGSGSSSFADGHGTSAHFNLPVGVAVDGDGNIIVADQTNHRIRKITPRGDVTTVAGSGSSSFADGHGTSAHFNNPVGVAVDGEGNIIVADYNNHRIRKITPSGDVTTVAGSGSSSFADGHGTSAHFNLPRGVAVDGEGNIIVADYNNHRIRKITPSGDVTTVAGSGSSSFADGHGTSAHFNNPVGVAVDGEGNIIVADYNHRIRKITPSGDVTTVAGSGSSSFADGHGTSAHFNHPHGVAVDGEGNIIVADFSN